MKILIIGQAPPAKEQKVPYDSTLLYEMLSWVDITKERAQDIFEFEAVSREFRGHNKNGGHLTPLKPQMEKHWENVLKHKFMSADKIIILGNVAKKFIEKQTAKKTILLPHPSRRNYSKIMARKDEITNILKPIVQS